MLGGDAHGGVLLEETLPGGALGAAQQRDRAADHMRAHPFPDAGVELGEIALADLGVVPIDAVGMRQRHALDHGLRVALRAAFGRAAFDGGLGFRRQRLRLARDLLRQLILAQALERGLTHAVAMRPAVEIDFGDELRLDPNRRPHAALFLRHRLERRGGDFERVKLPIKLARDLVGKAGARASSVAQFAVLVVAEHQRPHGMRVGARRRKACDHQLLAVRTFALNPVVATAGMISGIGAFRDDAFQPQFAGMLEQRRSRFGQRFAQTQRSAFWCLRQQPRQRRLARPQRLRFEIGAVEMHEIEDIEHHAVVSAVLEIFLQQRKAGNAVGTFRYQFAVDQRGLGWQVGDSFGNGRKLFGPVEAAAREQLHLAAVEPSLDAIAVEFNLVDPVVAVRRVVDERGQTRFDKCGQGAVPCRRLCGFLLRPLRL